MNLFREDKKTHPTLGNALLPNIRVRLVANDGTVIATTDTGVIPNSVCGAGLNNWKLMQGDTKCW